MTSVYCQSRFPWSLEMGFHPRDNIHYMFSVGSKGIRFPVKASLRLPLTVTRFRTVPISRCSSDALASTNESDSDTPPSIYIKGFPHSTTEAQLRKVFTEFGKVQQVKILIDKETGESLCRAYIWINRPEYAELAVKQLNGKFFDGKYIYVSIPKGTRRREKRERTIKF